MSVVSRPVATGKTRTCPHCKATILESLSVCPGCLHHLRFDSEAASRQVASTPALRVEGMIRHPPLDQPLEYFVIISIRNDRGEEITRQVVNVGALQAAEKRTFTLSVEVLPPQGPAAGKSSTSPGAFKAPSQPAATVRPSAAGAGASSAETATQAVAPGAASGSVLPPGSATDPGSGNGPGPSGSGAKSPQTGYPGGLKPPTPGGPKPPMPSGFKRH